MRKQYIVELTLEERAHLVAVTRKGGDLTAKVGRRADILLALSEQAAAQRV